MWSTARFAARAVNGIRKVSAGLTPFGESVWPGVRNDLFIAHVSIYEFFAGYSRHKTVLDAGCGTGYGCHLLAASGASKVLGIDIDARSIRYARKNFESDLVEFLVGNCELLETEGFTPDLVVSSNMLEHLSSPESFLGRVWKLLPHDGCLVLALPPILSKLDLERHKGIHYHRSNLSVDEWLDVFDSSGWHVNLYRHWYNGIERIDFASPFRSKLDTNDFAIDETNRDGLYARPPITAIYELRKLASYLVPTDPN
jgi:SAM-dependent methyltransferase